MNKVLIFIVVIGLLSSCLKNLNKTEFFRKLEIKHPEAYNLIYNNQQDYEQSITKAIEEEWGDQVEWVTFWGASRYACGNVVYHYENGKDVIFVLGEVKFKGNESSTLYRVSFEIGKVGELVNLKITNR